MTIHLPPDIERSIQAAVHSGHFASVDDAMIEAASLLLERLKHEQAQPIRRAADQLGRPQAPVRAQPEQRPGPLTGSPGRGHLGQIGCTGARGGGLRLARHTVRVAVGARRPWAGRPPAPRHDRVVTHCMTGW